jgi:S-adenosylmethionine uptake transporter
VFFQESVTGSTLAGAILIILGCLIASRAKPKLAEPTEVAAV